MVLPEMVMSETVASLEIEPWSRVQASCELTRGWRAYNRDTVAARAGVPLEDDVAALVDGKAVILVHDYAVLDGEIGGATVETIRVVAGGLAIAGRVGLITSGYANR